MLELCKKNSSEDVKDFLKLCEFATDEVVCGECKLVGLFLASYIKKFLFSLFFLQKTFKIRERRFTNFARHVSGCRFSQTYVRKKVKKEISVNEFFELSEED